MRDQQETESKNSLFQHFNLSFSDMLNAMLKGGAFEPQMRIGKRRTAIPHDFTVVSGVKSSNP
jgi:hypothetical protein